jgi:hypothetical protein
MAVVHARLMDASVRSSRVSDMAKKSKPAKQKRVVSVPTRKQAAPVKQTELKDAGTMKAFQAWKDGTPVKNLVADLKTSEFTLRMRFINIAGGRDAFDALRKSGAGGRVFGGKKHAPRTRETVTLDDAKCLRLKAKDVRAIRSPQVVEHMRQTLRTIDAQIERAKTPLERHVLKATKENAVGIVDAGQRDAKHKGWTALSLPRENGYELHLIRPDGQQFIRAATMERADVVIENGDGSTSRWRSAATASRVKVERAVEAETAKRAKGKAKEKKAKTQKHSAKKRR